MLDRNDYIKLPKLWWITMFFALISIFLGSIVGGGIAFVLFLIAICVYVNKKLGSFFKANYIIDDTFKDHYEDSEIDNHMLPRSRQWLNTKTEMILKRNHQYSIHLDLVPKISQEMSRIEARFNPKNKEQLRIDRPEVMFFQDITPPHGAHSKPGYKIINVKGMGLNYVPSMPVTKGGKALDYLINIRTNGEWLGKLSLRYEFANEGVKFLRVKVKVI